MDGLSFSIRAVDVDEFLWSDRPLGNVLAELSPDTLCARVRPIEALSGDDNAWRFLAREALALSAWKQNDPAAARRWLGGILDQEGVPGDVASRARTLLELIDAAEGKPAGEGS